MNAPHPLQQLTATHLPLQPPPEGERINLLEYWDLVLDNRWLVASIAAAALAVGTGYALLSRPVYESNLLIQIEDSAASAKSFLGEAATLFDVKTAASAEMEILRSRMVLGQAVDNTHLYIDARPRYLPVVGYALSRHAKKLSTPGVLGLGGWVTGTERIEAPQFDVPAAYEGTRFRITALGAGRFRLTHSDLDQPLQGAVGAVLKAATPEGELTLRITALEGQAGAQFNLVRNSRLETIEDLQEKLKITEKGRQSGVLDASLQDSEPARLQTVLNEIGNVYVRQNIERKAAEAQKTLGFLDVQLPQLKRQLEQSEDVYSHYRNKQGTVSLDDEAKAILSRGVDLDTKLVEAQQKRVELVSRYTPEHPAVKTLDVQINAWRAEINALNSRIKTLPMVQQDSVRLERDVKVNNELYQQLRSTALQLQLIREGKIGNARLIDTAPYPEEAVRPKKALSIALALVLGVLGGVFAALVHNALFRGIRNSDEIEAQTGLNVYCTIPLSDVQRAVAARVSSKQKGMHVLAEVAPQDAAVESLRSLRTALQFAMLDAHNNRVVITGPTPGIGKSFISANFAAVMARAGKRVLLIDADLRKGHLNQYFGCSRAGGLSEVIVGSIPTTQAIHKNILPNLDFITTGVLPPNPADLVVSGAFAAVLDELSPRYDLVIVDTAPVLVAADTASISLNAGTVLLVARAGQTQLGELHESARRLAHAGRSISGVLFNAVDLAKRHYGSYGYRYGGYQYRHYEYGNSAG